MTTRGRFTELHEILRPKSVTSNAFPEQSRLYFQFHPTPLTFYLSLAAHHNGLIFCHLQINCLCCSPHVVLNILAYCLSLMRLH